MLTQQSLGSCYFVPTGLISVMICEPSYQILCSERDDHGLLQSCTHDEMYQFLITFEPLHDKINQRTSGPVNAHLTPGPGIYFNAFIYVYSTRAGADNPLGTKF